MSDKIVRLNDHRDAFAPPVIEEFLRTGLLLPNLRDGILQSMDAEHARARQVLDAAISTLRAEGIDEINLQGAFADISDEMFGDADFPSAIYQRMMLFRERLFDQYKAGAPYVLERDELKFLVDNLKKLCGFIPIDDAPGAAS